MRHRSMGWGIILLCALVCAACGSGTSQSTSPTFTSVPLTPTLPTAPGGTVSATIPSVGGEITPSYLYGMDADDTAVWVHNSEQGTVLRVDPTTNKVVATIPVGHGLGDLRLGDGAIWVSNHDDSTISRIDPETNQVVATIALPPPTGFLAVSPGAVWVASKGNNVVMKIDPQTNQVVATISDPYGPSWMGYSAGSLWICNHDSAPGVIRLDPMTNQVLAQIDIGSARGYFCGGLAATDAGVWAMLLDNTQNFDLGLVRIDPATNQVIATTTLPQSMVTDALAADAQGVWVAEPDLGLFRISPQTNQAVGLLPMTRGAGVALGAGSVWLAISGGTLLRITPAS